MSGYLHFYAQHPAIALIAEKLNESGNAFHNTADWQDETDYLGGKSACDIVQEALNAADEAFNTLAAAEGGGVALERTEEERANPAIYISRLERERTGLAARVAELERAVDLAARAMAGEGVEDQGQAWDRCLRILDAARSQP